VPEFQVPDDCRLIVTSHDCDVAHQGIHEPRVEVCPAVQLGGGLDGNYTGTRNARRLHIDLEIDGERRGFELRAPTRFALPREILQESAPDLLAQIRTAHLSHFRRWLAKRVRRTALPTAFDGRVSKQVRSQLRRILRPLGGDIDSILIALDPEDIELPDEQPYRLQVVALIEPEVYEDADRRAGLDRAMGQIGQLLEHCRGIELDACVTQSMAEMTVDVFRSFDIWDYDELSLEGGLLPPEPAG
jgi:hypothetical protein